MLQKLRGYNEIFENIAKQSLFKWFFRLWAAVATYDLIVSQFIPEEYAKHLPKAWQFAMTTGNILPLWGWLLILAGILVLGALEYAYRIHRVVAARPPAPVTPTKSWDSGIPEEELCLAIRPYGERDDPTSTHRPPLRSMASADLRTKALELAHAMRAFEAAHKARETVRMHRHWTNQTNVPSNDEVQRKAVWDKNGNDDAIARADFQQECLVRYHADAVAMWKELQWRTGAVPDATGARQSVFLEHGMFAGVNPVIEAAEKIEELANKII